jgi:hypothetical protein
MVTNPELEQKAMELLNNSTHRAVIIIAITSDAQVRASLLSHCFTERAQDACIKAASNGVRHALEQVHHVARSEREN